DERTDDAVVRDVRVGEVVGHVPELRVDVDDIRHQVHEVGRVDGKRLRHLAGDPLSQFGLRIAEDVDRVAVTASPLLRLEDPGVDQQAEVLRPGLADEIHVVVHDPRSERGRRVDLRGDHDHELRGVRQDALYRVSPDRIGYQVEGHDAEL